MYINIINSAWSRDSVAYISPIHTATCPAAYEIVIHGHCIHVMEYSEYFMTVSCNKFQCRLVAEV